MIGGYTAPKGSREELGALLLGYFADGEAALRGKVGTGFDRATLRDLAERLGPLRRERSPFVDRCRERDAPGCGRSWSRGRLHRVDARRPPAPPPLPRAARGQGGEGRRAGGAVVKVRAGRREIEITHSDRVMFPDAGVTKADLARYYAAMAGDGAPRPRAAPRPPGVPGRDRGPRALPQERARPLSRLDPPGDGGQARRHDPHVLADDVPTLVYLAGQNAVALHVWPAARTDRASPTGRLRPRPDQARLRPRAGAARLLGDAAARRRPGARSPWPAARAGSTSWAGAARPRVPRGLPVGQGVLGGGRSATRGLTMEFYTRKRGRRSSSTSAATPTPSTPSRPTRCGRTRGPGGHTAALGGAGRRQAAPGSLGRAQRRQTRAGTGGIRGRASPAGRGR